MNELPEDWTNDYIEQLQNEVTKLKRQLENIRAAIAKHNELLHECDCRPGQIGEQHLSICALWGALEGSEDESN